MSDYVNTPPEGTRTYRAFISVIADANQHHTVVMVNPASLPLPLSAVDVVVGPDELFIATSGNGETWYFADLEDAWCFTKNSGCAGTPDAIQILTPMEKDGIKVWNVIPVHQRAVSVNR